MRAQSATAVLEPQGNDVAADDLGLGLIRRCLREAIGDGKHAYVAAALGIGAPYLSQMLAGEKPISARHLRALPDDIEAEFAKRYAEAFGHIVVTPLTGVSAVQGLVGGLVGLLTDRLPVRAKPAKADLR